MEEEKSHSESHHAEHTEHKPEHHENKNTKVKKVTLWKSISAVLGILLVVSLYFNFSGAPADKSGNEIPINKAADEAVSYINNYLLQSGATATLKSKSDIGGLYNLKIEIEGREFDSYVTKDGKLLFPSSVDLTTKPETEPSQPTEAQKQEVSVDDDPSLGPDDAKVIVIEFSDFECPFCGAAAGTHESLIQRFKSQDPNWEAAEPKLKELAKEGRIKLVFRDFPLNIHKDAQKAAEASECAHEQDKFWDYHDKLFENQEALGISSLKEYAAGLGLDKEKFNDCLDSGKYEDEVQKDLADGTAVGISGTPAFFINGRLISGAQPFSAFEEIINEELAK